MSEAAAPTWLQDPQATEVFELTLCANVGIEHAQAQLDALATRVQDRTELSDTAWRWVFEATQQQAWTTLQSMQKGLDGIDAWITPVPGPTYKLLICDMDMTIVAAETLDEVAASLGLGDEIAAITKRAMQGEIDFNQALRQRILMLAGHDESVLTDLVPEMKLHPGAEALLEAACGAGVHSILVSGGFSQVADAIGDQLGFDEVVCNRLELEDGKLTGDVLDPIVNAHYKLDLLQQRAMELEIDLAQCCAIGDGANDKPMIEAAGLGIAYFGKPVLRAATACQINHTDLNSAIYFMGL